jgi:hypothetical protein
MGTFIKNIVIYIAGSQGEEAINGIYQDCRWDLIG